MERASFIRHTRTQEIRIAADYGRKSHERRADSQPALAPRRFTTSHDDAATVVHVMPLLADICRWRHAGRRCATFAALPP